MTRNLLVLLPIITLLPLSASCQADPIILPPGTQLPVSTPRHLPMRVGEPIRADLLYPVYNDNKLVLPAGTAVLGSVLSLSPDHKRRVRARLGGDFTPLRTPVVQFTSLVLHDGSSIPIATKPATDGAPIYRLVTPPRPKGGFVKQQIGKLKLLAEDRIAVFTAPEKRDRLLQYVYSQLPYHPQRIAKATAWTLETAAPVTLPATTPVAASISPAAASASPAVTLLTSIEQETPPTWTLESYLTEAISSESSKAGQSIQAIVAEPVLNPDGTVAVPQGSILSGTVTQAHPARRFARPGELRFSFRQLTLPGQPPQSVRASLVAADSAEEQQLALNSEGNVKAKPQDKIVVPLILIALAVAPLHQERGHEGDDGLVRKDAFASNSLGLLGFIAGTAAQQANLAVGIGAYGAALSIYQRIFSKGKEVSFARDTRVVLQTTTTRSTILKAQSNTQ